jgi:hypothetical protein
MNHPHSLASVAHSVGVDIAEVRKMAEYLFRLPYTIDYDRETEMLTDVGCQMLEAQWADEDELAW